MNRTVPVSCPKAAICLLAVIGLGIISLPPGLHAQITPEEHAKHHPDQAKGKAATDKMGGGKKGKKSGGMMGGGMGDMMKKMGVPPPKELYPKLIDLPDLGPEERARVKQEARQRMLEGKKLLSTGLDELTAASQADDAEKMEAAAAKIREGVAQFESGLAAYRALAQGKAPRNVALQWFKREMNLIPPPSSDSGFRLFGMTLFHTTVMVVLIAFSGAVIRLYYLKMRRATDLMQQLVAAGSASGATGGPTGAAQGPTTCGNETAAGERNDSAPGLLRVAGRTLCRLEVAAVIRETPDVKTFRLVACHGGPLPFSYLPGQFLTLKLPAGDRSIHRSYTISSSPTQGYYCEITVKREEHGVGSRYLHDVVQPGDKLEVQAPSGKFTFSGKEADDVVLIAGGVGITPMMSIVRALTDMGWRGEIDLIVACRDVEHFIFRAELMRLAERFENLHLHVAMSRIATPVDGFHAGRLTKERLSEWVPEIASKRIHLCGAPPMMEATKQMLFELGVPADHLFTEKFGAPRKPAPGSAPRPSAAAEEPSPKTATVTFAKSSQATSLSPDETILDASERIGVEIDYSCRVGMCGICRVKLLSGEVTMEVEDGLEPQDRDAGMILSCQAKSTRDVTVEA